MIWVDDLQFSSFSVTFNAVPIYWQQYTSLSSNFSLSCVRTDNKNQLSLGTDWSIVALKDTKCALHTSYPLNKILSKINTGLLYNYIHHILMQKWVNILKNQQYNRFIKTILMMLMLKIILVVIWYLLYSFYDHFSVLNTLHTTFCKLNSTIIPLM